MTHIKTVIKVVKHIETTNHKTGEITNLSVSFLVSAISLIRFNSFF